MNQVKHKCWSLCRQVWFVIALTTSRLFGWDDGDVDSGNTRKGDSITYKAEEIAIFYSFIETYDWNIVFLANLSKLWCEVGKSLRFAFQITNNISVDAEEDTVQQPEYWRGSSRNISTAVRHAKEHAAFDWEIVLLCWVRRLLQAVFDSFIGKGNDSLSTS